MREGPWGRALSAPRWELGAQGMEGAPDRDPQEKGPTSLEKSRSPLPLDHLMPGPIWG